MRRKVGTIDALFRYPVKSMAGEGLERVDVGWRGLEGDRRLAFRRCQDPGGFPWLTASKLPELLLFSPTPLEGGVSSGLPSHVRTPEGKLLGLFSDELAEDVGRRYGAPVEMTHLDRGIFDEAVISVIARSTVQAIGALSGSAPDVRRFRPNILIKTEPSDPFGEDAWVGGMLTVGDGPEAAVLMVTNWDQRCSMVNYDPDSGKAHAAVLKTVVRERANRAGVYCSVVRGGQLMCGQPIFYTSVLSVAPGEGGVS